MSMCSMCGCTQPGHIEGCPEITSIESEARQLISVDRRAEYGPLEESMGRVADSWSSYLGTNITPKDVAYMMTLLKIHREKNKSKRDKRVDAVAYLLIADQLTT